MRGHEWLVSVAVTVVALLALMGLYGLIIILSGGDIVWSR